MRVPRLSLRTWILLPAIALVATLVLALSVIEADTLVRAWIKSSEEIAELSGQQVKQTLLRRLEESSDAPEKWAALIQEDEAIAAALVASAGRGGAIVEVSIADASGRVLASSDIARQGAAAVRAQPIESLEGLGAFTRFRRLFQRTADYEHSIPIGIEGDPKPMFTIQVLVSTVLLRDALGPGMRRIAIVAAVALALSILLVSAVAAFTTRNLKRLGNLIDQIAGGSAERAPAGVSAAAAEFPAAEFAAVGSKLSLLDNRVRGALEDAEQYRSRVNAMLERLEEAILLFHGDRLMLAAGPMRSLLGCSAEEISGRRRRDILPPEGSLGGMVEKALAEARPVRDQFVPWTSGLRERRLIVNLDFIGSSTDPAVRLALLRVRDAEGAGEVESQLQLSTRLEAINRLTGGVAHEIKNPLNAISARLALLESIVADESPEAAEQIETITAEIERLDRVVRTFLDFTQPLELARDAVDLASVAREVCELLTPDAAHRGIQIAFENYAAAGLPVCGDRDLLKQAVMNLAVNAIEAMDRGGELRLRAFEQEGAARLSVADTGPGIPAAQLGRIFDLYFTTKAKGSGIGLAVAYRTAQLHGGQLTVESEIGRGSTFNLTLPMVQREDAIEEDSTRGLASGAGRVV